MTLLSQKRKLFYGGHLGIIWLAVGMVKLVTFSHCLLIKYYMKMREMHELNQHMGIKLMLHYGNFSNWTDIFAEVDLSVKALDLILCLFLFAYKYCHFNKATNYHMTWALSVSVSRLMQCNG